MKLMPKVLPGVLAAVLWSMAGGIAMAQQAPGWPAFKITKPDEKEFTTITHFVYREMKFDPPVLIQPIAKAAERYGTAEEAMVSRVSAMMALEYEWFMTTWDSASRKLTVERDQAAGRTKDFWLQQWKDMFRFARVKLVRRIETREYVILTYHLVTPEGKDIGQGIEFPAVFKISDGRWAATQDLAADDLPDASPWVTGKREIERTVR